MSDEVNLDCPNADALAVVDKAALLKMALEMIERQTQAAGDEYQGTLTARRLVDGGFVTPAYGMRPPSTRREFLGYVFTMRGNAAVGELGRLLHAISGLP